jgi:small GTP-binding protein
VNLATPTKPNLALPHRTVFLAITMALGLVVAAAFGVIALTGRAFVNQPGMAIGCVLASLALSGAAGLLLRENLKRAKKERDRRHEVREVLDRVLAQSREVEATIERLRDDAARDSLKADWETFERDRERPRIRVVVFGTVSAGKSALVNAIVGREIGPVAPTHGTTSAPLVIAERWSGLEGDLEFADTPGISESGTLGRLREAEALDLARDSELVLFVVDNDLVRSELEVVRRLASFGKRLLFVFNKTDLYPPAQRAAILDSLRNRLAGIVDPRDILATSAAPQAVKVVTRLPDGTSRDERETPPPDLGELPDRLREVLSKEGEALRAASLLLRGRALSEHAASTLADDRRLRAGRIVDQASWNTAAAVFANPFPAIDLLAPAAISYATLKQIAAAYDVKITEAAAQALTAQLSAGLLRLGLVEATASLIAGLFKRTVLTFAAAGAVQALALAYLSQIAGQASIEYFANGQAWGPGGVHEALVHAFAENGRIAFLDRFARRALVQFADRFWSADAGSPSERELSSPARASKGLLP